MATVTKVWEGDAALKRQLVPISELEPFPGATETKRCPRCGRTLPQSEFDRNRTIRDGLAGWCKRCKRETAKPATEEQREARRIRARERMRRLRAEEPEKVRAAKRAYYARHRDRLLAKDKQYREKNAERIIARSREYHARLQREDPERARLYWRVKAQRRRSKTPRGLVSARDVLSLLREQGNRCAYCETDISKSYEIEHVVPLSRGGQHCLSNIVLSCRPCNTAKGRRTPEEWLLASK